MEQKFHDCPNCSNPKNESVEPQYDTLEEDGTCRSCGEVFELSDTVRDRIEKVIPIQSSVELSPEQIKKKIGRHVAGMYYKLRFPDPSFIPHIKEFSLQGHEDMTIADKLCFLIEKMKRHKKQFEKLLDIIIPLSEVDPKENKQYLFLYRSKELISLLKNMLLNDFSSSETKENMLLLIRDNYPKLIECMYSVLVLLVDPKIITKDKKRFDHYSQDYQWEKVESKPNTAKKRYLYPHLERRITDTIRYHTEIKEMLKLI